MILSTVNGNNYAEYIGTSMAAPHVAAVSALIKELKPSLTGETFKAALAADNLTNSLSNRAQATNNYYDKGLINATKSVNLAKDNALMPALLSDYTTKLVFNGSIIKTELRFKNPRNIYI